MTVRIVAVVIVLGLAIFVYTQRKSVEAQDANDNTPVTEKFDQEPKFLDPTIQGVEPATAPKINVGLELRHEGLRNVLYFTVTEEHGWYVDHVYIEFWYVQTDENGEERKLGDPVVYLCHNFLGYGKTLVEGTTLLDVEFPELEGNYGTTENWRARIQKTGKVLAPK